MTRKKILLAVATFALAAALAPPSEAAKATADNAEIAIDIESPDSAVVTIEQAWEGQNAKSMRQSLDVFFGASDGRLTDDELGRIAAATESDMRNSTLPFVIFDGQPARVRDVNLSIEGAAGKVENFESMTMHHTIELDLLPTTSTEHAITLHPMWNGMVRVNAPDDWAIGTTTGVEAPSDGRGLVEGVMMTNNEIVIPYSIGGEPPEAAPPKTNPPTSGSNEPEGTDDGDDEPSTPAPTTPEEVTNPPRPIPAGGIAAATAALAIACLVAARRRSG